MQSQLHNLDPSLRSGSMTSSLNAKSQTKSYSETAPQSYSPIQPSPGTSYPNATTPSYYNDTQQGQESPDQDSPNLLNPHDPNDLKRPRACEACRQLKVKCEFDDNNPTGSCKRCAKAHRQCVITVPSRKRQKKTDSRVAELEKKIDALTASLAAQRGHELDTNLDPAIAQQQYQNHASAYPESWRSSSHQQSQLFRPQTISTPTQASGLKRRHTEDAYESELRSGSATSMKGPPPTAHYPETSSETPQRPVAGTQKPKDVIEQGLIDVKTAYRCFERYCSEMCQELPIVVFPRETTAEDIRRTKPILFLAVIGVACGTIRPDLQSKLISETTRILADRIVYTGEKSMEIVQSVQVMTVFYQPPERYEELNFNQMIHIAAVMAMDIGMGKRARKSTLALWKGGADRNKVPDANAAESRRCWLGCYYMCSNSAMSLRRSFLLRWSAYCDECIEILETAPDAVPSDKWLCHLVKAQRIGEEVSTAFFMDDAAKEISLSDNSTQKQLAELERELDDWRSQASPDMTINPIMQHTEGIIDLYMHEIAMHNEHNVDDFRPPYHATPIEGPPNPETPLHLKSLGICLRSAHTVFDAFLSMDMKSLRSLPTLFFVRTSYAAVALIKMYTAIAAKGSNFIRLCKPEDLKVDHYLERLITTLTKVAEDGMSKVAYKFSLIFNMLKSWHVRRTGSPNGQASRESSQNRTPQKKAAARGSDFNAHPMSPNDLKANGYQQRQPHLWQPSSMRPSMSQQGHQHSGLQMLSDAAMAPNPQQAAQGQWISSPTSGQQQRHMRPEAANQIGVASGMNPSAIVPTDAAMMAGVYGLPNDQVALMDFTSDELMAYGFGDEFMAMNFGFDQGTAIGGGWAI